MNASEWPTTQEPTAGARGESAVLMAARQLSQEAALRPRVAGLTGLRRLDAETRSRRAVRRMAVMPAA
ncbi:MAG: hypothetical protein M3400_00805 [Actinomycetota bacterium]|nr:hypothetical protein [Actinomycetota bacterium]